MESELPTYVPGMGMQPTSGWITLPGEQWDDGGVEFDEKPIALPPKTDDPIRNELTCAVCHDLLFKPITLICQHNFCKGCVSKMRSKFCPICHVVFVIPAEFNRTLDAVSHALYADDYGRLQKDADNDQIRLDEREKIREELKKELFAEIVQNTVNDVDVRKRIAQMEDAIPRQQPHVHAPPQVVPNHSQSFATLITGLRWSIIMFGFNMILMFVSLMGRGE